MRRNEATVRKIGTTITARVVIEVVPSESLRFQYDLEQSPDDPVSGICPSDAAAIEAACGSGAVYAMHRCGLGDMRVIIRSVLGTATGMDVDGFAAAAGLAVARAAGREDLLPREVQGEWEAVD
jgi:hypothetical protein